MAIEPMFHEDTLTLVLSGRLAGAECGVLREKVAGSLRPDTRMVHFDMSGLEFIDSGGLGALVGAKMTCRRNNAGVTLLAPQRDVLRVLLSVQFDLVFDILTSPPNPGTQFPSREPFVTEFA